MAIIRTPWRGTIDHPEERGSNDIGRSGRGWTVVVGAAALAVASLTVQVASAGGELRTDPPLTVAEPVPADGQPPVDPYTACMLDAPGTADSLEHWVDICRDRAERAARIEAEYTACMLDAPATADSLEHWFDVCRDRAEP